MVFHQLKINERKLFSDAILQDIQVREHMQLQKSKIIIVAKLFKLMIQGLKWNVTATF